MAKLGTCAVFLLTVVGASSTADAWASDDMPTKAPPAPTDLAAAPPRTCIDPSDFITTNCQLTWHGITLFGTIDAGFGWQSHGAPWDPRSAVGASYLIQKQNRSALWSLAPNALSNALRRMAANLRAAGIEIQFSRANIQGRSVVSLVSASKLRKGSSVIFSDGR